MACGKLGTNVRKPWNNWVGLGTMCTTSTYLESVGRININDLGFMDLCIKDGKGFTRH